MAPMTASAPPRGRLAPSPTGALHIGNARTFLLAWLSIRSRGGTVILRIDDLDGPRVKAGAERSALEDLRWLGLDWDEGPFRQTERIVNYQKAIDWLVQAGLAYPCVCTRSEIETAASAPNAGDHETRYPGTCRGKFSNLTEAQAAAGRPAALRFITNNETVYFNDIFRGRCEARPCDECGDFIIEKVERSGPKTGLRTAAYQLSSVVDDAEMNITEILRGDDLLSSTARQILLQKALGLPAPALIHTPLLVGEDGRRLAKRHGDTTIARFRAAGVPAARVTGWLAGVSGLCDRGASAMPQELVATFALERVPRVQVVVRAGDVEAMLSGA